MFKKERAITAELKNNDHEFNAADFRLRQSYSNFVNNYKKMFKIELELIDNLAGIDKEDKDNKAPNGEDSNTTNGGDTNE